MKVDIESLKDLNREGLLEVKTEVEISIKKIKDQLAEYNKETNGKDSEWRRKASFALRKTTEAYQKILLELSKRNNFIKKQNISKNNTFERRFIDICRDRLDNNLFQEIKEEALSSDDLTNPYV